MRKNLLLLIAFMMSYGLSAQFVIINSPADCAGAITFGPTASWGAFLTDSVWTGDLVIVDDGTALPTEGCSPLINGADVAGNFALIDRGSCNFSLKALNAQNAGAVAVVIANHTPGGGVIDMGAGDFAADVTIPCVMITYEDGAMIKDKIEGGTTVNMTMGDFRFDNDVSITRSQVVFPPFSTVPANQVVDAGDYVFQPGALVTNKGLEEATNVTIETTIDFDNGGGATQVYSETETAGSIASDSSAFITLANFDPSSNGTGTYTFTYAASADASDEATFDNEVSANFDVSQRVFSKARWDAANNRPMQTNAYTIAGGGQIEMLTGFEFKHGVGYKVDSVMFYVSTSNPSLANISVVLYLYKWVDEDEDGNIIPEEINLVAFGLHEFDITETQTGTWVTAGIEDLNTGDPGYVLQEDNERLVIGTRYEGPDLVFFGFDEGADLNQYINNVALPSGEINDMQYPYFQATTFGPAGADFGSIGLFTDFWGCSSTALLVDMVTSNRDLTEDEASISLYPNPSTDKINVEIELSNLNNKSLTYEIIDMMGRVIYTQRQTGISHDNMTFDVNQLTAGTYELIVRADDGMRSVRFVVE